MDSIFECTARDEIMANMDLPRPVLLVLGLSPEAVTVYGTERESRNISVRRQGWVCFHVIIT